MISICKPDWVQKVVTEMQIYKNRSIAYYVKRERNDIVIRVDYGNSSSEHWGAIESHYAHHRSNDYIITNQKLLTKQLTKQYDINIDDAGDLWEDDNSFELLCEINRIRDIICRSVNPTGYKR